MKRFLGLFLFALIAPANAAKWQSLFDGKTLTGWQPEGAASWSVEDGAITGRQGPGAKSGDLYTAKQWVNFEFECEYKVEYPLNTGIWFRRNATQPGYQADIIYEPKDWPGAFSGSIYSMKAKGFIAKNPDEKLEKHDGWNTMRVRAVGDKLTVWLNGKQVTDTTDNAFTGAGRIGIQVHPGKYENLKVQVRKARVKEL